VTPPREAHSTNNPTIAVLQPETLFLVLEFATEGPLIPYLNRILTGRESDWPTIIQFISDVVRGLEGLHERGLIHRLYLLPLLMIRSNSL
jgi:serine/threonine protein kinase